MTYGHMWVCSAVVRGGTARGRGHGFKYRWPRSHEKYRDLWLRRRRAGAGAGRWGPPPIKKILYFFRFFSFQLPDRKHSAKTALPTLFLLSVFGALPSAPQNPVVMVRFCFLVALMLWLMWKKQNRRVFHGWLYVSILLGTLALRIKEEGNGRFRLAMDACGRCLFCYELRPSWLLLSRTL
jgi:hypothetical protein